MDVESIQAWLRLGALYASPTAFVTPCKSVVEGFGHALSVKSVHQEAKDHLFPTENGVTTNGTAVPNMWVGSRNSQRHLLDPSSLEDHAQPRMKRVEEGS